MILDCDACLARLEDKPRYCRSKVGLSEVNGVAYIVLINSRTKEKLRIENIVKLYNSSIAFKNPDVNLMMKNGDPVMLKLLFTHLRKLINGEKLHKLPDYDRIKNEKPKVTTLHQVGDHFDMNVFKNSKLNKLTIERATLLPKQIWNLNHLTELQLIDCSLDELPERLCRLGKTLKLLNLSNNRLCKVDKLFFAKMPNLVALNLSNNRMKFVPLDIVLCRNLVTIDLSNNQLTNLPYTIVYLRKLAELNISSNQIRLFSSSIWISISTKLRLTKLDISNNYSTNRVNQRMEENKQFLNFKVPTLRQLASNSVTRKPQLFCNLSQFVPTMINDTIEEEADLCSSCKKPYATTNFFETIRLYSICDLANGSVLNEEPTIWLCNNLCSICKFNLKFKRLNLVTND